MVFADEHAAELELELVDPDQGGVRRTLGYAAEIVRDDTRVLEPEHVLPVAPAVSASDHGRTLALETSGGGVKEARPFLVAVDDIGMLGENPALPPNAREQNMLSVRSEAPLVDALDALFAGESGVEGREFLGRNVTFSGEAILLGAPNVVPRVLVHPFENRVAPVRKIDDRRRIRPSHKVARRRLAEILVVHDEAPQLPCPRLAREPFLRVRKTVPFPANFDHRSLILPDKHPLSAPISVTTTLPRRATARMYRSKTVQ